MIIARISKKKLIEVITNGIDKAPKPPVWGRLSLQIVVDLEGNSCLLSMHNQTTLLTAECNLKKDIDQNLVWEKPARSVAALVVIDFFGRRTAIKRVAFDENTGWHELTAKPGGLKRCTTTIITRKPGSIAGQPRNQVRYVTQPIAKMNKTARYGIIMLLGWFFIHTVCIVADGLVDEREKGAVGVILGSTVNADGTLRKG
jgi:hypothetical protein